MSWLILVIQKAMEALFSCNENKTITAQMTLNTDQPKNTPCPNFFFFFFFFFAEKNKNHFFRRGLSPRNFAEKLCESLRGSSATIRRETPQDFAEKHHEILRWVGKDFRFLHAGSEDSDQTEKLSECLA